MNVRTWAATAAAVLVLPALAGCGGDDPEGNAAPVGAVERSEQVSALNLAIVTEGGDVGTLVGTLLNETEEADTLVGVEVETEDGPVETFLLDGPVELPPGENVRLGEDPRVGLQGALREGLFVEVTLEFASSPDLSDPVPVEPTTRSYDDIEVPEVSELTGP